MAVNLCISNMLHRPPYFHFECYSRQSWLQRINSYGHMLILFYQIIIMIISINIHVRVGLENIRWTVSAFNDSKNLWTKFSSPRHRRMTEWQQTNREKNTQTHTHTLDPNTKTSGNCNRRQCARKETKKKSFLFRFWICHKMCLRRVKFTNIFRAQNNAAPLKIAVPHAVCGDGCSAFAF